MLKPSPHSPSAAGPAPPKPESARQDPRWIAAQARYIGEHGSLEDTFTVRIAAATEMRRIEREYEAADPTPPEPAETKPSTLLIERPTARAIEAARDVLQLLTEGRLAEAADLLAEAGRHIATAQERLKSTVDTGRWWKDVAR